MSINYSNRKLAFTAEMVDIVPTFTNSGSITLGGASMTTIGDRREINILFSSYDTDLPTEVSITGNLFNYINGLHCNRHNNNVSQSISASINSSFNTITIQRDASIDGDSPLSISLMGHKYDGTNIGLNTGSSAVLVTNIYNNGTATFGDNYTVTGALTVNNITASASATFSGTGTEYSSLMNTSIVYLKFDEDSGSTMINSVGTNGSYVITDPSSDSVAGLGTSVNTSGAMRFNSSGYGDLPVTIAGDDITISMLIQSDDKNDDSYISSFSGIGVDPFEDQFAIIQGFQNGYFNVFGDAYPTNNAGDTQIAIPDSGVTCHLAYVSSGTNLKGYLNGTEQFDVTVITGNFDVSGMLRIATRYLVNPNDRFKGVLDEFAIFDRALTPNEITILATGFYTVSTLAGYYVDPTGSASNSGSIDSPWSMEYAISGAGGTISTGDTIWLREGTHTRNGIQQITLNGASGSPITFRGYPGEHAVFDLYNTSQASSNDVTFVINGDWLVFQDFEVTDTSTGNRVIAFADDPSYGTDSDHWRGWMNTWGSYNKFIHLVVHDCKIGFGHYSSSNAKGNLYYNNIIYNNGWLGTDRGHGHGMYMNCDSAGVDVDELTMDSNIIFTNFGLNIQLYGDTANADIVGGNMINNTIFYAAASPGSGYTANLQDLLVGRSSSGGSGNQPHTDINIYNNYVFSDPIQSWSVSYARTQIGYNFGNAWQGYVTLSGNYFASRLDFDAGSNSRTGPTYIGTTPWSGVNIISTELAGSTFDATANINSHGNPLSGSITVVTDKTDPNNRIFYVDDQYDDNRATITIYNWAGSGTVNVNLSGLVDDNIQYAIYDSLDYYGTPVVSGTFDIESPLIGIPMADRPFPKIFNHTAQKAAHTEINDPVDCPQEFGCFIVKTL